MSCALTQHFSLIWFRQYNVKELHISNVSNSTIIASTDAITGAMHVTSCHDVKLVCQAFHQLRIHESSDLRIHIHNAAASGGAILEDCTDLVFYVTVPSNVNGVGRITAGGDPCNLLEVKDFNWLRNGIPSPNFIVETEHGEQLMIMERNAIVADFHLTKDSIDDPKQTHGNATLAKLISADAVSQPEESDEDEL